MNRNYVVDSLLKRHSYLPKNDSFYVLLQKVKMYPNNSDLAKKLKRNLEELEFDRHIIHMFCQEYHDLLCEIENGTKRWTLNDVLHCSAVDVNGLTLPAFVSSEKTEWRLNGECHRYEVGKNLSHPHYNKALPASIETNGTEKWYYFGRECTQEELTRRILG